MQDVVGFGDELHVAVLDAVVHHLHVVAGPARADVGHARLAIDLGGDGGEDRLDQSVGIGLTAGHHAGTPQRAFLPAGYAHAQETQPYPF